MDDLYLVILNSLLYFILLCKTWYKQRKITVGIFLLFTYFVISVFCIVNYVNTYYIWDLTLAPFIYLLIVLYLFIKPFLKSDFKMDANLLCNIKIYKLITNLYIVLSLYSCVVYLPIAIDAILNPDWTELYNKAHLEKDSNIFTKLANLFLHVRYLGIVLFFVFLASHSVGKLYKALLGLMAFLPILLVCITQASRGGILTLIASFAIAYFFMKDFLSVKIRRVIQFFTSIIIPFIIIYILSVTISRFEESNLNIDATSSIVYYLGHSMLIFNYGIVDTINKFSYGAFMFNLPPLNAFYIDFDDFFGTHFGTDFFTFVGGLYLDFGPIITFIIALVSSCYFGKKIRKKSIDIPDAFLIMTFAMFLFNGVFVVGRGYAIQWLETMLLYLLLKKVQKIVI